jgi:hypothetical protein
VQLYGYKSAYCISLKIRRGGMCHCCCCEAHERQNKGYTKRNRKRARRLARKEMLNEQGGSV